MDLPEPDGPMIATNSLLPDGEVHAAERAHDLAAHDVLALQVADDDDGVARHVRRQHRHPLRGIAESAGHRVRPISASICALARR